MALQLYQYVILDAYTNILNGYNDRGNQHIINLREYNIKTMLR